MGYLGADRFAGLTSSSSKPSSSLSLTVPVSGSTLIATFDALEVDGQVTVCILAGKTNYTSKPLSCGEPGGECTDVPLEFPQLPSGLSSLSGKSVQLELSVAKAV